MISVGDQLPARNGSYTGGITVFGYQWQRSIDGASWADIGGATFPDYVVTNADLGYLLSYLETATNLGGSIQTRSSIVGPVGGVATALLSSWQAVRII